MPKVATVTCKKHGIAKVAMVNAKGAPMLGCIQCHPQEPEQKTAPAPAAAPKNERKTTAPKRSWGTFFRNALEG